MFATAVRLSKTVQQQPAPTGGEVGSAINPLNTELNPICHLLALLGVHFLHVSRIRVKVITVRKGQGVRGMEKTA